MDSRRTVSPESALASDIFDKFCSANTLRGILNLYRQLCSVTRTKPTHFPDFYPRLRAKLCSWRAQGLWSKFEKRAAQKCYGRGKACYGTRVLIIGAGPCGLRAAIEAQLLGAKVVLIEKRDRFSRNNVLHLWPFVITDLKALGAKKFYGKFCAGSIDHISIRQIQCILLKVALLLGVEVHEGVGFEGLREPTENEGWRAYISPSDHPVSHYTFDVLIGADGRRNTLDGFKRKALRAKLAIAITANFINKHTEAEARVKEISGVSYIFNQKFFQDLCEATGIDLENIVYYKDETHYFVMTAKKQSLLNKGVLLHDYADTAKLLSHENISTDALMVYALEAATFATEYQLPDIEFAVNHYGQPDVGMFDFTAMYAAENACRVVQKKGHKLLMTLVGDSLLEPFWPTGSGCARGFLSSFDACWMIRSWTSDVKSVLEVVAERESIYRLLGQTTPENLHKEHMAYTIDPHTRYPNLNLRLVMPFQVKSLYEADEKIPDLPDGAVDPALDDKTPKKRRRDSVIAIDSLLSWMRDQVVCYNLEVIDVREAFVQGDVLCAVIHRFRPDLIEFPLQSEENVDPLTTAAFRNQLAFDILHQEYGLPHAMSGYDSVQFGTSEFLTLVTYLSQIYEIFRGEIPQTKYFKSESGDELEENVHHNTDHLHALRELRMAVTAKHHFAHKAINRKGRLSSGGDSEPYRKHKKRRSDERAAARITTGSSGEIRPGANHTLSAKLVSKESRKLQDRLFDVERFMKSMRLLQLNKSSDSIDEEEEGETEFRDVTLHLYRQTVPDFEERKKFLEQKLIGRESKTVFGKSLAQSETQSDSEKLVPGLAKDLEAKFKGRTTIEKQKPKDLIRAIGKIEKSDWNVQLIEKKMAETKSVSTSKKDRENKVPRWSREAYDDKRDAMKRKMDGATTSSQQHEQVLDETFKKLGNKLKHGNALDIGQRGCNKVSAMAEQLIHKLERPNMGETSQPKQSASTRQAFELPKKGRVDLCHFCKERVYVVERMTAEGKFFHRNCFRCEYCNTSLRIGNYVFDREGRYGERFYCSPHYTTIRMCGWKKFDNGRVEDANKYGGEVHNLLGNRPSSQQILSEMDERGTTPERVEFENSVDFASEEELLNEMDEDEWTDRNFGLSNADNTSDEASDLSDDEEVTPEGNNDVPNTALADAEKEGALPAKPTETESSDSDTEVASEDDNGEVGDESDNEEEEEEDDDEYDEDEEDEEEEEECGGSTTEIETDSEFAEDPPNSVPGSIPTIVVDAPEQLVTKLVDTGLINHAKHVHPKESKPSEHREKGSHHTQKFRDLYYDNNVELVKKGGPERQLPVVTGVPKKWEPNPERLASKVSLELKKKYLQGSSIPPVGTNPKKADPQQQNQFRSVLDMISEQQKLLQPASKPSATMQAFLDGADKLKNKTTTAGIVPIPLNRNLISGQSVNLNQSEAVEKLATTADVNLVATLQQNNGNTVIQPISPNELTTVDTEKTLKDTTNLIISSLHSSNSQDCKNDLEKQDLIPESIVNKCDTNSLMTTSSEVSNNKLIAEEISGIMTTSDTPSFSTSETGSNKTVIDANDYLISGNVQNPGNEHEEVGSGSDTEVGSEPYSDLDDLDEDDLPHRVVHEPPRVEIEDEFGVTKPMDPPPIGTKDHLDKSPTGHSSSDSSLNSGIFLETEMSDYVKDESVAAERAASGKKRLPGRRSLTKKCKQDIHQQRQSLGKLEDASNPKTKFELEGLDFVDIDGGSSPDDFRDINEIGFGIRDINPPPVGAMRIQQNTISAPPLDTFAPKCHPESQSPPITSPSEDDERSSTSTRDPQDHSTSDAELSDSLNNCLKNRNNISEVKFYNDIFSSKHMPTTEKLPSLERVVPFSGARDSLDYRKARGASTHLRNKDLYSTYSTPSTKPLGSEPEVIVAFSSVQFDEDSGVPSLEGGQDLSSLPGSTDDSNRSSGSPSTTRKLHEIRQERVKQNDLIRSMVLGRIKRSPDKTIRKNSKGSSSGTSLNLEKSGDEEADSRISSDASQYPDDNTTSEDCDNNESASRGTARPNLHHHHNNSSTDISSGHDIPHKPMAESNSNSNSDDSCGSQSAKALLTTQAVHSAYEPVFTSSPRFRNRPKFDVVTNSQQQQPQTKTEPPTPTHAIPADMPYPTINSSKNNETSYTTQNPLFCRSMPNLVNLLPKNNHTAVHQDDESNGILPNTTHKSSSAAMYQTNAPRYEHPSNPMAGAGGGNSSKINPFLVSSYGSGEQQSTNNPGDDFLSLHLKLRSKDQVGNQRTTEKSRSVYSDSSKDYSDSGYGQTSSHPSSVMTMRIQHTQIPDQDFSLVPQGWSRNEIRPRSNTLTDFEDKTHSPVTLPNFNVSKSHIHPNTRHSIDNSDASSKSASNKAKAFSSDTLVDASPLSESSRRTSVPDISGSGRSNDVVMRMNKGRKGKDRDRRRSLIQTVSDFFTSRTTQNSTSTNDKSPPNTSLTTSTSSSSIMSPTKDKFSIFKLTPKLLQNKDKKNSSKSKESVVVSPLASSGQSAEGRSKTDFTTYLSQPDLQIQRLSSSPTIYKAEQQRDSDEKDVDECAGNMANLSIMAPGSSRRANLSSTKETDRSKRAMIRAREIEEIQLQLESIETDQRSLEAAGVIMEKKLRGEEVDEDGRSDNEIMEEWFALVRDKTKLARFEKELLVRAQELELEVRREQLEEQLEVSLSIPDKTPNDTQRENDIMHELRRLKDQHVRLLDTIHSDMERYTSEDVTTLNTAFSISPGNSRLESDV